MSLGQQQLIPKVVVKVQHFFPSSSIPIYQMHCDFKKNFPKIDNFFQLQDTQTFSVLITQVRKLFCIPHLSIFSYAHNFQKSHLESGVRHNMVTEMKKLLYFQFDLLLYYRKEFSPKGTFSMENGQEQHVTEYNALVKVTPDAPKAIMELGGLYLHRKAVVVVFILSRFACIVIGSRKQAFLRFLPPSSSPF